MKKRKENEMKLMKQKICKQEYIKICWKNGRKIRGKSIIFNQKLCLS
jgi:hypothetical protein